MWEDAQLKSSAKGPIVFCAVLVVVFVALKIPTLNVPIFGDETYVVTGGWDVLHGGFPPYPREAETYGHPPVGFELVALTWSVLPQRPWTLHLLCVALAVVALVFTFLVGKALWSTWVGAMAATMLAASPVFFSQAGILTLDLLATTFGVIAVYALLRERWILYLTSASLLLLSKESSVCFVPAMFGYVWLRSHNLERSIRVRHLALCMAPMLTFVAWIVAHKLVTGYWWGDALTVSANRDILVHNLQMGLGKRFGIRWIQLVNPDRAGVLALVFLIGAVKLWGGIRGRGKDGATFESVLLNDPSLGLIFASIIIYLGFHTILGVLHPRYLLPVFPFVFLIAAASLVKAFHRRAPYAMAVIIPAFVFGWFRSPDKFSAPEASLDYVHAARAHEAASAFLEEHYSNATILASAYQSGVNLVNPIFGYVRHPLKVLPVGRGSTASDLRNAKFDLVYLSSTDQFGQKVEEFVRARGLRDVRTFTSGRHYAVIGR